MSGAGSSVRSHMALMHCSSEMGFYEEPETFLIFFHLFSIYVIVFLPFCCIAGEGDKASREADDNHCG